MQNIKQTGQKFFSFTSLASEQSCIYPSVSEEFFMYMVKFALP